MKVKKFILGNRVEIQTLDGKCFQPKERENYNSFLKRVTQELGEPLNIVKEVTEKNIKSLASKQAEKQYKTATGLHKQLLENLLIGRGIFKKPKATKSPGKLKSKKVPTISEAITKTKAELDFVENKAKKAKSNVGKGIDFYAFRRDDEMLSGTIKAVWIDKRVPMALYKIELENKVIKNKVIGSEDIVNIA